MKDYHNFSLKCDVLLLADVFEKFRNNNLKNYELCPSHYLSAGPIKIKRPGIECYPFKKNFFFNLNQKHVKNNFQLGEI